MNALEVLDGEGPIPNEVRKLESRLWRRCQKDGLKVLMFTSALQGEGKSTTAALFATAAALHRSRKILIIDLDFRWPKLHTYLGMNPSPQFREYLLGHRALENAIQPTLVTNLFCIPGADATDHDPNPDRLLNSSRLADALEMFRQDFDLVVLDVPALVPVADAATLIPQTDGILLVVMAGQSTRHHLTRARDICLGMEGNILGLVVGNIQEAAPEYLDRTYQHNTPVRAAEEVGSESS
jgi:capsular exopolysaccharide synthesis family protein